MPRDILYEMYAIAVFLCAMALFRHRKNIRSLLAGTERKAGRKGRVGFRNKFPDGCYRSPDAEDYRKKEKKNMAKVGVIGAGSWGTALSVLLHGNGT